MMKLRKRRSLQVCSSEKVAKVWKEEEASRQPRRQGLQMAWAKARDWCRNGDFC